MQFDIKILAILPPDDNFQTAQHSMEDEMMNSAMREYENPDFSRNDAKGHQETRDLPSASVVIPKLHLNRQKVEYKIPMNDKLVEETDRKLNFTNDSLENEILEQVTFNAF